MVTGRYLDIRLPKLGPDGRQLVTGDGELLFINVPLPCHVNELTHAVFDPTGLVPVICNHGLPEHPNPDIQQGRLGRLAVSWVRSKYASAQGGQYGKCVIDLGQDRPDDLTMPRDLEPADAGRSVFS